MKIVPILAIFLTSFLSSAVLRAEEKPSAIVGNTRYGRVLQVTDFDNIKVKVGERELTVAMAGLLPLSAWSVEDGKPSTAGIKQAALQTTRTMLEGHEVGLHYYREPTERNEFPLVFITRRATTELIPGNPSARTWWGHITCNLKILELGHSPWVRQSGSLKNYPWVVSDEWFQDAIEIAKKDEAGIGDDAALRIALEKIAHKRADPPPLVIRDLDRETFLQLAELLTSASEPDHRMAGIRAIGNSAKSLDDETREKVVLLLAKVYQQAQEPFERREVLYAIRKTDDLSLATLKFLQEVAATKSDDQTQEIAQKMLDDVAKAAQRNK